MYVLYFVMVLYSLLIQLFSEWNKIILAVPRVVFTCSCRFVFAIGGAQQPAALTVAVVIVALFTLRPTKYAMLYFCFITFPFFPLKYS